MPRTKKPTGGGKRYPLNMRTTRETRERLEAAAAANGRSLAQEVEVRLERSFAEEQGFGGPAMLAMANLMAGAFLRGGQLVAAALGRPDQTPDEWIHDKDCYRGGAWSVGSALGLPLPGKAEMSDPAAVLDVLTAMVAHGAPLTISKEPKK
jgi:TraY domain